MPQLDSRLSLSFSERKAAWAVAAILAAAGSAPLLAQTSTGSVYGDAPPGTVVTIKSAATGLTRNITVGADGKFTFTVLPPGLYTVTEGNKTTEIQVTPGEGAPAVFTGEAVEEVVVSAALAKHIDNSTPQVYTTYSSEQLADLPVPKDIASYAVLAPGAVRGTGLAGTAYSTLPSISGSGIAENTYYINGFNVTNLFSNTSYATLPFPAIASEQVITGGYGPEYGMATGGVVSLQTKKGTNTWEVGGEATWDPNSLRSNSPTTYLHSDGTTPYRDYSQNTDELGRYDVWASGPIIKDKLFIYVAAEFQKEGTLTYPNTYQFGEVIDKDNSQPFGLVNLDYIINDRNSLEFTYISNQQAITNRSFTGLQATPSSFITMGDYTGADVQHNGGWLGILKYTGNITDDLTVSAQYGQLVNNNDEYQVLTNGSVSGFPFGKLGDTSFGGCPSIDYTGPWTTANTVNGQLPAKPTCQINNGDQVGVDNGRDVRRSGKIEASYKLALPLPVFATQTFEAGYDFDRWTSKAGTTYPGGALFTYENNTCSTSVSGCNLYAAASPYTGNYYQQVLFQTNAEGRVNTDSYYFKDSIQVTKTFMVTAGVRNDSFDNINGAGETYLSQKDIWQPRFGATWDVEGNSKSKLYANYGIYTNPVTAGVAIRGASASDYCFQYFKYTGMNSTTGQPIQGAPLATNNYCVNGETGMTPPAGTFASSTLSPTKTREFVVGFQQALWTGWTAGIEGTYTNLLNTIDDYCDFRGFYMWAADHNVSTAGLDNYLNTYGASPCFVLNPGKSADLSFDVTGSGKLTNMNITPAELGLPDAIRKYVGVNLTLDKAFDGKWGLSLIYTWSHQYGNTEGTSESDNSQADIGTTENFDYPQIMEYSYGDLPNDHRHTIKGNGEYQAFKDLLVTGNLLFQTGKPENCIGFDAAADAADGMYGGGGYGAVYHECGGVPVPRGSVGRLPNLFQLDVGLVFTPSSYPGLALGVQVFNIFNKQTPLTIDEQGEQTGGSPDPQYMSIGSYQMPRYVELTAKYQFDFAKK